MVFTRLRCIHHAVDGPQVPTTEPLAGGQTCGEGVDRGAFTNNEYLVLGTAVAPDPVQNLAGEVAQGQSAGCGRRQRDADEPAGDVPLEQEDDDGEQRCESGRGVGHSPELFAANTQEARLVGAGRCHGEDPDRGCCQQDVAVGDADGSPVKSRSAKVGEKATSSREIVSRTMSPRT
jgi:hypothetical protein